MEPRGYGYGGGPVALCSQAEFIFLPNTVLHDSWIFHYMIRFSPFILMQVMLLSTLAGRNSQMKKGNNYMKHLFGDVLVLMGD